MIIQETHVEFLPTRPVSDCELQFLQFDVVAVYRERSCNVAVSRAVAPCCCCSGTRSSSIELVT